MFSGEMHAFSNIFNVRKGKVSQGFYILQYHIIKHGKNILS